MTPEQIKNVQGFIEGDMNLVDGYDELTPEAQAKVDFAIKNGHVPDEDWRGVCNIYLRRGMLCSLTC